jgi:CrcB protein
VASFLWVCLGSAVGGGARYLVTLWALRSLGTRFPWGTLAVNLVGTFLIAAILGASRGWLANPTVRLALTTGVMGGFTTYSAFGFETLKALQEGLLLRAAAYVLATLLGGLAAAWLGWTLATR